MLSNKRLKQVIAELSERDGFVCRYCSCELILNAKDIPYRNQRRIAHVDHMLPRVRGGSDDLDNLALCCQRCNYQKHDKTPDEFAIWRATHSPDGATHDERVAADHAASSRWQVNAS